MVEMLEKQRIQQVNKNVSVDCNGQQPTFRISFCALFVFVFPFQSAQEEKIKRLRNMICSAGREDSGKPDKEKMAKVCSFLLSSLICGFDRRAFGWRHRSGTSYSMAG